MSKRRFLFLITGLPILVLASIFLTYKYLEYFFLYAQTSRSHIVKEINIDAINMDIVIETEFELSKLHLSLNGSEGDDYIDCNLNSLPLYLFIKYPDSIYCVNHISYLSPRLNHPINGINPDKLNMELITVYESFETLEDDNTNIFNKDYDVKIIFDDILDEGRFIYVNKLGNNEVVEYKIPF